MLLSRDVWNEWAGMEATKQFLKDLEQKEAELLQSIYKKVMAENIADAKHFAGYLDGIKSVIEIIHSKKESANESKTE